MQKRISQRELENLRSLSDLIEEYQRMRRDMGNELLARAHRGAKVEPGRLTLQMAQGAP